MSSPTDGVRGGSSLDSRTFEALLDSAPVGAALFDPEGRYRWVNAELARVNGLSADAHVGRRISEVLPEPVAAASKQVIDEVIAQREHRQVESTVSFPEQPDHPRSFVQSWYPVSGDDGVVGVCALVWEVTDERSVQAAVAAASNRLQLALEAGGMGTWDWDLKTGVLRWDERTAALFGIAVEDFAGKIEAFSEFVHPDDVEVTSAAIEHAIESRGEFRREYRIVRPDGMVRWVSSRGRVLMDEAGELEALIGVIQDRTETHSEGERLARTLETMGDAFFRLDADLRFTYVNGRAEQLLLRSRAELIGEHIWEQFPEAIGTPFQATYERVRDEAEPDSFEAHFEPLGLWVDVRAHPDDGGVAVYFHDITDRRRRAEAEAAAAEREVAAHQVAARLLDLAPRMHEERSASGAAEAACRIGVEVFDCLRASVWRVSDEMATLLAQHGGIDRRIGDARPIDTLDGMRDVVESGRPRFFGGTSDTDGTERAIAREVGARSFICAPVDLGGDAGTLLITINFAEAIEPPGEALLDVAARFAQQTALAVEQSRRREVQVEAGRLSSQLQTNLLPIPRPLPEPFAVGSLYQPGERRLLLGGDFSDVLPAPGGGITMVIGDVTGHGPEAAAIGAALRAGWRALALQGVGPAAMLPVLDALLRSERTTDEQLVTICCVEVDADGRTMRVASAGHPPPIVTMRGTALADVPVGALLGLPVPVAAWEQEVVEAPEPWALLLYTDGLPEARSAPGSSDRLGLEAFAEHVAAADPLGADDLNALLRDLQDGIRALAGDAIADDVALLMVRHR